MPNETTAAQEPQNAPHVSRELRRDRQRLLDIAATHGVHDIRVFGSLARGEAGSASDVDFLVNLAPGRTLLDLAAFRREAEQLLGAPVEVATSDMLKERIRANVLPEAVPL
jgi:uncharacterized protein